MKRLFGLSVWTLGICVLLAGCTGGAAGDPSDDVGDIRVLTTSPGNGDELDPEDSSDGFNALNNPTLRTPGAVTIQFTNSLDPTSVLNPDPTDPQGTRNVRLFFFDPSQGPFDPTQNVVPGVNPPGANVIVESTTVLTTTKFPNDTLIIRPAGISAGNPLPTGQYSVVVEKGVRGADGDGLTGSEYFCYFRVGQDTLPPVVVKTSPAAGEKNVDPSAEIRITMTETILASTVNNSSMQVFYQPTGTPAPIPIPGEWYVDGGNGPGNNFPARQLDHRGLPGFSGVSPRNGVDLVFRPALDLFPVNMLAENILDPFCTLTADPPEKGNRGFPLGQTITVQFAPGGSSVTDTAGNGVPVGSPLSSFTFETKPQPPVLYSPRTDSAIFFGDTQGVGVIDIDPNRSGYLVGPTPPRGPNAVVTAGTGVGQNIVKVPVADLVELQTDSRVYSAFYTFWCFPNFGPNLWQTTLYALSGSTGGGEVTVIDTFTMQPLGRFGTPSPGGIGLTAFGAGPGSGRAAISNFSANTVTVFDISDVRWFTGASLPSSQAGLASLVTGTANAPVGTRLIMNPDDFNKVFPQQRAGVTSPPGPPVLGTINVGISPSKVGMTGLPFSMGIIAPAAGCFSPLLSDNPIVVSLNAGENTADFIELNNLSPSQAIEPTLDGVNLSSQPTDVAWTSFSFATGSYYFFITGIGGTVELFASGLLSQNVPSVHPNSSTQAAPNKIINNIGGLEQPTSVSWAIIGQGVQLQVSPTISLIGNASVLVTETGQNRIQQLAITSQSPSNLFQTINANHPAGLGPIGLAGDPASALFLNPCSPSFTTYYVANAGEGTVRVASYAGGVIGQSISVPGVLQVASWWNR